MQLPGDSKGIKMKWFRHFFENPKIEILTVNFCARKTKDMKTKLIDLSGANMSCGICKDDMKKKR